MNNGTFNALDYTPNQGTPRHPEGKFPFNISHTEVKPGKDGKGTVLVVTFSTNVGSIQKQFNVEHDNVDTQRIAREQLSALCHAVGKFQLNFASGCQELRNGQGVIEVAKQTKNPEYNEVRTIFDQRGELPKGGQQAQQGHAQAAPPAFAPQPQQQPQQPAYAPQPMAAPQQGQVANQQPQWAGQQPQQAPFAPQPTMPPQQGQQQPPFQQEGGMPQQPAWAQAPR